MRDHLSYGQHNVTWIDRLGVYLSSLASNKHLPRTPDIELLDIGCGYHANLLRSLAHKIKTGTGIDFKINPELHRQTKNLTFLEEPVELAVNKLSQQFHVIMMISVFEHLNHPVAILENCFNLLKKNG